MDDAQYIDRQHIGHVDKRIEQIVDDKNASRTTMLSNIKNSQVITFGCRLNIYESEIIKNHLHQLGDDNVIVFNSCAVTKKAERDARQAIRRAKRQYPTKRIIVTGCAAQNNPEQFALMNEVDRVIGNEEKLSIKYYMQNINSDRETNIDTSVSIDSNIWNDKIYVNDIMSIKETASHIVTNFESKSRAFIQVQNGCDHRCTFCIIPYARGNSRSVPIGEIVKQLRILVQEQQYQEIVLTGVDTTAYGKDLPGTPSLAQMIKRVLAIVPEVQRLRLSSIDVAEIDDELFELLAHHPKIMPHIHISLQSGDNMILKRMKRRHNREQTIQFCNRLRAIRKEIAFGADIIAGFPTETDLMFENTRSMINEAELQYLHVFAYSSHEKTPASRMPQVAPEIRKERVNILRIEGQKQLKKFYKKNIGCKVNLLVENGGIAHTENFIPVKIDQTKCMGGKIYSAVLTDIDGEYMRANLCV